MTDLEEATMLLREAIDILEHPEYPGCCTEAAERIEDALAKLKNVEDAEDQLNAYIEELQKMRRMQKARPTNLTKHFGSLDIDLLDDEPEHPEQARNMLDGKLVPASSLPCYDTCPRTGLRTIIPYPQAYCEDCWKGQWMKGNKPPVEEPEKEGGINSEPCRECNTSIPYGPGTEYESHPTVCPNCGASTEEK